MDTMQQFEKKAKSSTASATPDSSQLSKLVNGDILPAVPIPNLTDNKRAWRKHTSQESKARKKRRAQKFKEIARSILSSAPKLKADSKIPAQSVPAPGADGNLSLISASPVFVPEASGKIPVQSVPASGAGGNLSLISASPVFVPEASGKIPAQSVPVSGANGSLSS